MRKSRRCPATAIQRLAGRLLARTCLQQRGHTGKHTDEQGAWEHDV